MSSKDLVIYTNRSSHNGHIGAAMHSLTINITKSQYVDTDNTHNIYRVELTAIQIATRLFEAKTDEYFNMYIFVDSQSVIQAIALLKR